MPTRVTQTYANSSDETLIRLVRRKDPQAYEVLYDRHAQVVYNLLMRIVQEPTIAEELLQETYWQVWQKADQYDGSGAVAAWLYRMARNKALDQLRQQKARPQAVRSGVDLLEQVPRFQASSAESEVEQAWRRQQVLQALESIPNEQRLCLELAFFEDMSQREIAEQTNTPLGTIKTRMRIGMEKLERILRAVGYIEGES